MPKDITPGARASEGAGVRARLFGYGPAGPVTAMGRSRPREAALRGHRRRMVAGRGVRRTGATAADRVPLVGREAGRKLLGRRKDSLGQDTCDMSYFLVMFNLDGSSCHRG
ncbi:hypothetical protein Stsp01_25650 [Streptomyces sp. NBRC 13847]|nr:hypothetical protein Stsp01_25650 [Streptomyces sp. NBRC 13847]